MSMPVIAGRDQRFSAALDALAGAPGGRRALAVLRRAVGSPRARFDAYRVLARVAPSGVTDRDLEAYELVAGLYAVYHQGRSAAGVIEDNLGASFAVLAQRPGWDVERAGRRLVVLIAADRAVVPERLRRAISLLRSAQVPIDWARLVGDVRVWNHPDQLVQRRWARAFVSGRPAASAAATEPAALTNGGVSA